MGKKYKQWQILFWGGLNASGDCSHEIKRCLLLGRKVMTNLECVFKSRNITLSTKVRLVKAMVFAVVMYGCESWTIRKAECRRIDILICGVREDSFEFLGQQNVKPVNTKGNQPWIFTGRTDDEGKSRKLWSPDSKTQYFGKDLDAGKDWEQDEKGTTED